MLRNKYYAALAVLLVGSLGYAVFAVAQSGMQLLTTLTGVETVALQNPCTVSCGTAISTIAGYDRSASLLYTTTGTAGSAATTAENTLASYSLPANTLIAGTKLKILASFTAGSNAHNKTFKCYFGASVISSGVLTTNAKNGSCEMIVTKIAASQQIAWANMLVDVTPITGYEVVGTDTDTSAITIKFTATSGTASASDIVLNDFSVERLGK